MRKLLYLAIVSALVVAGPARAEDVSKCCAKDKSKCTATGAGCSKAASLTADASEVCPKKLGAVVDKVMDGLPRMIYLAGDTKTVSYEAAVRKAGCESKVGFQVAGQRYESRQSASEALADLLEDRTRTMMAVQTVMDGKSVGCSKMAAKMAQAKSKALAYRLAGVDFDSSEKAKAAAAAVRQAVSDLAEANPHAAALIEAKLVAKGAGGGCCPKSAKAVASAKAGSGCGSKRSKAVADSADVKGGCGSKSAKAVASAKTVSDCSKDCAGKPIGECSKACLAAHAKGSSTSAKLASGCGQGAEAKAGAGCCPKSAKAVASAKTVSACSKECAGKCTEQCSKECMTACAKAGSGCCQGRDASAKAGSGCSAKTAAVKAKSDCCSKSAKVVAGAKKASGCGQSKSASAKAGAGCCSKGEIIKAASGCGSKGQSVAADKPNCCEKRLADIQDLLRVMVETAVRKSLS